MANSKKDNPLPQGHIPLPGSERHPSKGAELLGPADPEEKFQVTIVLRRRTDGPPMPDFDAFAKTSPGQRPRLTTDEFAEKYGAHPDDMSKVVKFAEKSGLKVIETHPARRTVVVSGTVAQMSKAFGVTLSRYQHTIMRYHKKKPLPYTETYRGRDGSIHVPKDLAEIIVGVFGLDNRTITKRNQADPPNTTTITIQQVTQLYIFPTNSAAGQTIGIISPTGGYGGYFPSDLQLFFGASLPTVTPTSPDGTQNGSIEAVTTADTAAGSAVLTFASTAGILPGSYPYSPALSVADPSSGTWVSAITATTVTLNQAVTADIPVGTPIFFNPDGETTQDICIAGAAAPGADIAVFFSQGGQDGWVNTIKQAVTPGAGDPVCSVLSSSFYICDGDDANTLANEGISTAMVNAISQAFQDAAAQGQLTICIAAGDTGSNSKVGYDPAAWFYSFAADGKAHVQYPPSDPSVLAVGGTTIGNIVTSPPSFDEYVWNDPVDPVPPYTSNPSQWGTTGGGVSDFFGSEPPGPTTGLPSYQNNAGVPKSVNDNHIGRGIPDVAANASYNSGYSGLFVAGEPDIGNGTSAAAPLWAGLIAVINAALGEHVGFINPSIYKFGSSVFRDIDPPPGPSTNSNCGIAGYTAGLGWDACTGWGSPNGVALLKAFQSLSSVYISGGYQSADIILTDLTTHQPVPLGGAPGGPWDTLLEPSTNYGLSAVVHNDSATAADNVQVTFWAIPGGVGTNGSMVGVPQTVSIPAYSSVTVPSPTPFTSAPPGQHLCAVVSLYSASTGCATDATTALEIPDPGVAGSHSCSAWRNTDSMLVGLKSRFGFTLGLGILPIELREPILLQIDHVHVPFKWSQRAKVKEIEDILRFVGAESNIPLYLLPDLYRTLSSIPLKTTVRVQAGGKIEERGAGKWRLLPSGRKENTSFEISGEIPASAKAGDIVLVKVVANYPRMEERAARSVEFLEVIHVTDKINAGR